jgi:acetyltransferase-like isoleucine patch superfamily enzyme/acyl carrier protein
VKVDQAALTQGTPAVNPLAGKRQVIGLVSPFWRKQQQRFYRLGIRRRHHLRRQLAYYVVNHGFEIGDYSHGWPDVRTFGGRLKVGKYCSFAKGATFVLGGQHPSRAVTTFSLENVFGGEKPASRQESRGDIVVGSDVWIASNAVILSGVTIGDGAVVGLGSVVLEDVPPYSIVFGNPARVVDKRFSDDVIAELLQLRWWDLDPGQVAALRPLLVESDIAAFLAACRKCRGLPPRTSSSPPLQPPLKSTPIAAAAVRAAVDHESARSESWTAAAVSRWCVDYLATTLELPPDRIDASATFASLGMDSVTRTSFIFAIEEVLNVTITSDDMIERPTIARLADHLAWHAREANQRT